MLQKINVYMRFRQWSCQRNHPLQAKMLVFHLDFWTNYCIKSEHLLPSTTNLQRHSLQAESTVLTASADQLQSKV